MGCCCVNLEPTQGWDSGWLENGVVLFLKWVIKLAIKYRNFFLYRRGASRPSTSQSVMTLSLQLHSSEKTLLSSQATWSAWPCIRLSARTPFFFLSLNEHRAAPGIRVCIFLTTSLPRSRAWIGRQLKEPLAECFLRQCWCFRASRCWW